MSQPDYCVVDTETTMKSSIGNNKATAFDPANSIVLTGWRFGTWGADDRPSVSTCAPMLHGCLPSPSKERHLSLLVGHHLTFDIHHLLKAGSLTEEFLGTINIWDTQLAEYLLTGQRSTYASLDELAVKYGGTLKDDKVKKLFEAGKGADEIDRDILEPYLKADVLNTELVFKKQVELALEMDMLPLIQTQMDALLATTMMSYNGLKVDAHELMSGAANLRLDVDKLETTLKVIATQWNIHNFNPGSTKQLSMLLFGGHEKVKKQVVAGTYKNGNTKYKTVVEEHFVPGMGLKPTGPMNGKGDFPTDDKALNQLLDQLRVTRAVSVPGDFLKLLLEWREKDKQLGTYWEGMLKLVMPDGFIHHQLNHCITRTGRLSSSDPNLQNVTNGDIKKVFVSRFGDEGVIVEADYSQLEMVELAIISNDHQLMADIAKGVDMHNALFKSMYGRDMKKDERKKFKRCSFALVYGAGATGIAEQGGISPVDARTFIETFYKRYPGVKAYHDNIIAAAALDREYHGLKDADSGKPVGEFVYVSEHTKRRYWFREYAAPDWMQRTGIEFNFSPTELKNYMVQGGATGDKVPLAVGQLYRVLRNHPELKDKCLMVNTVHDSILFDVHKDVLDLALSVIKANMEALPDHYEEWFGYRMPLEMKVGLSVGPNWLDQTEVNYDHSTNDWRKAA